MDGDGLWDGARWGAVAATVAAAAAAVAVPGESGGAWRSEDGRLPWPCESGSVEARAEDEDTEWDGEGSVAAVSEPIGEGCCTAETLRWWRCCCCSCWLDASSEGTAGAVEVAGAATVAANAATRESQPSRVSRTMRTAGPALAYA